MIRYFQINRASYILVIFIRMHKNKQLNHWDDEYALLISICYSGYSITCRSIPPGNRITYCGSSGSRSVSVNCAPERSLYFHPDPSRYACSVMRCLFKAWIDGQSSRHLVPPQFMGFSPRPQRKNWSYRRIDFSDWSSRRLLTIIF